MKCVASAVATASTASTGLTVWRVHSSDSSRKFTATSITSSASANTQVSGCVRARSFSAAAKNSRFAPSAQNTLAASSSGSSATVNKALEAGCAGAAGFEASMPSLQRRRLKLA